MEFELCNYDEDEIDTPNGPKMVKVPKKAGMVFEEMFDREKDDLMRIGHTLFYVRAKEDLFLINKSAGLFAYLFNRGYSVKWSQMTGCITKEEFFQMCTHNLKNFGAISKIPHFPKMSGVYYLNEVMPEKTGKLDELVEFFECATELDKDLLRASFASMFWGKGIGIKPAFVFDGTADDGEKNRGIGKTTVIDAHCLLTGSGFIDLGVKADIEEMKKRLLTATDELVVRFDNIKQTKLNSGAIEALITSKTISAHKLFSGNASKDNIFSYLLTFNDSNFSKDFAQRAVIIRLKRPSKSDGWMERLKAFIENNRRDIIADIGHLITQPIQSVKPKTRFSEWEKEVLLNVAKNKDEIVDFMLVNQSAVDDDAKLQDEISDLFLGKISDYKRDHEHFVDATKAMVVIKKSIAGVWISELIGSKLSTRSSNRLLERNRPENLLAKTVTLDGYDYWVWVPFSQKIVPGEVHSVYRISASDPNKGYCQDSRITIK